MSDDVRSCPRDAKVAKQTQTVAEMSDSTELARSASFAYHRRSNVRLTSLYRWRIAQRASQRGTVRNGDRPGLHQEPATVGVQAAGSFGDRRMEIALHAAEVRP